MTAAAVAKTTSNHTHSPPTHLHSLTLASHSDIDFDEEQEPEVLDDQDEPNGAEDPEAQDPDDNVVASGDPSAAAKAGKGEAKNTVDDEKKRKVPNHERSTTPYMTKYERARVLGTRALQIR